jgi:phage portal protein BeeE
MNIFGRKSAGRASARPASTHIPLGPRFQGGTLGEWSRGYEAQARAAYLDNPVAQRAVRLVAEGVGAAPLVASDDSALSLVVATSGGQALLETLAVHLLLHGNGYVQMLCDGQGRVVELFALRPDRVTIEPDARG